MFLKRLRGLWTTFGAVAQDWLTIRAQQIKPATLSNYRTLLKNHLLAEFGEQPVGRIGLRQVEGYLTRLGQSNLSASSRRSIQLVLQMVLRHGEAQGLCVLPEFPPLPSSDTSPIPTLTETEFFQLRDNLLSHLDALRMGILLCMHTGLRIGEVCALRWSDIDLAAGTLTVSRTLQRVTEEQGTRILIGCPKSRCSTRMIPLPRNLVAVMSPFAGEPETYLLTGTARFMEPRCLQRKFKTELAQAGLSPVKFHALRHTFATRCAPIIDPKALSYLLGHSDVSTTMNTYVHPGTEQLRRCLEQLNAS